MGQKNPEPGSNSNGKDSAGGMALAFPIHDEF
ncbi:Hypothetical protein Bdt_1368 [Bdellovibrio bacteriovorus str. Tiberius]|uniref:Uncharacterized protein n=1 Tax=Bdellovibrio bacteriovorus str. Tiberius TaxID=1069642 RepID=K7YMN9_BDEBC|nr:Hypothetical protein Bdt_1368 [Bdellovibrio bacteriovorus str. Tiberius]